jgi:hypothetical protein
MVGNCGLCQLVLTDDSVSRFHAALVPTQSGLWVVDLLAREGVYVNGERVRWAWLAQGDTLRIGQFTFILRYETPPDPMIRKDVPLEAGASPAERPGTELMVSMGHPGDGRNSEIARPGDRSRSALKAANMPRSFEPDTLVRSDGGGWDQAMAFALSPMGMWQQQMQLMESFHNDMILMVQMFVAMHREHLASVRHELDMVQQLTGKLSKLQAKLGKTREAADVGPSDGTGQTTRERGPVPALDHKRRDRKHASREPDTAGSRAEPRAPRPADGAADPSPKVRPGKGSAPQAPKSTGEVDDRQVHSLLTERIAELQRERQGYWQRILTALHK